MTKNSLLVNEKYSPMESWGLNAYCVRYSNKKALFLLFKCLSISTEVL